MRIKKYLSIITLFFMVGQVSTGSAKIIHGQVKNARTGEALGSANIQIEGTYRGTISNEAGAYQMELKELPATLKIRYIGYQSQTLVIDAQTPATVDILLEPTILEFPEIIVTDEDPAVEIMRQVIRRKQQWRARLETFQAEAYTRLVLENDTTIVTIIESTSELYWHAKDGRRELIKSRRATSNVSAKAFVPASFLPNFYDDDIDIQGNRMIGPTHPDAIDYYHFKLTGKRSLDDQIVYDIELTPKTKFQPVFSGRIAVLDQEFALIEVDLKPAGASLYPPPIEEWNIYYRQQLSNYGQEFWFPVDVRGEGDIKVKMIGLEFPRIKYTQVSHLANYQVNVPLPDSLYRQKKILHVDSVATRSDTLLLAAAEVIPLTEREANAYQTLDSTQTLDKLIKPRGFLARFAKIGVRSGDEDVDRKARSGQKGKNILAGLSPQVWHNRVDGFHLGFHYKNQLSRRLQMAVNTGYKFNLERWSYGGQLLYRWGQKRNGSASIDFQTGTETRYPTYNYPLWSNSILTLLGFDDYYDYFRNKKWRAELGYLFKPIYTRLSLGVNREDQTSIAKTTDFDLLGRDRRQRANPEIQSGRLCSVFGKIAFGDQFIRWGTVGQKRFELTLEHAPGRLADNDFFFTRLDGSLAWRITTFYRRRFFPNALDLQLNAGTARGEVPLQRLGALDVSMASFAPFGVLKTRGGRPLQGENYLGLFWEHNFRTVPFEVLGLRWLVEQNIGVIVHGAVARAWLSDANAVRYGYFLHAPEDWHQEIGLGLNGLLGVFRLDISRRLETPAYYLSFGLVRWF